MTDKVEVILWVIGVLGTGGFGGASVSFIVSGDSSLAGMTAGFAIVLFTILLRAGVDSIIGSLKK